MTAGIAFSVIILLLAVCFQIASYIGTRRLRRQYGAIFPEDPEEQLLFVPRDETLSADVENNYARIDKKELIKMDVAFETILNGINNYLGKNRDAVDFAIIKDITDRNSDAVYEQIESASPVPIYIGLCGTLIGIVIGVATLAWGGGLDNLFNVELAASAASSGINDLLRGVAVAMLTTFSGVVLSIFGTIFSKRAQAENEKNKNAFFSWIQAELLPKMNNSFAGTLDVLQKNLNKFNAEFSKNSTGMNEIVRQINDAAKSQVELYQKIQELDIEKMATANVQVWRELRKSTEDLERLHEFLYDSENYLNHVNDLNDKLDLNEDRTKMFEEMASYFKEELEQITQRKIAMNNAVGSVDEAVSTGIEELRENTKNQYAAFKKAVEDQQDSLSIAIGEQKASLEKKLGEVSQIVDELKTVGGLKNSLEDLVTLTNKQSTAVEAQKQAIDNLVVALQRQNRQPVVVNGSGGTQVKIPDSMRMEMPMWLKIVGAAVAVVVVGTCAVLVLGQFKVI